MYLSSKHQKKDEIPISLGYISIFPSKIMLSQDEVEFQTLLSILQ